MRKSDHKKQRITLLVTLRIMLGIHKFVRGFEPWGIVAVIVGLIITFISMMLEIDDRQSERSFRAWEVVYSMSISDSPVATTIGSSVLNEAVEYLAHGFEGRWCTETVRAVSEYLTGDHSRRCVFPKKSGESFAYTEVLSGTNLSRISLTSANLQRANLQNTNLRQANLRGVDLQFADLQNVHLWGSNLQGANLSYSSLEAASLEQANLRGANLRYANLRGASLRSANLQHASFSGALLIDADVAGADLRGVQDLDCRQLQQAANWQSTLRDEALECGE